MALVDQLVLFTLDHDSWSLDAAQSLVDLSDHAGGGEDLS